MPHSLTTAPTYFLRITASVATLPHRTKKKILKHVLNKEPGRKEHPEERDEVAMALLS